MNIVLAIACGALRILAFADQAAAATYKKRYYRTYHAPPIVHRYGYRYYRQSPRYYERLPDSVPFGSKRWWTIQEERNMPSR
jgi:hypothetical protein